MEEDGLLGVVQGRGPVVGHDMALLRVHRTSRNAFPQLPTHHRNRERQGFKESLSRCHVRDTKICSATVLQNRCVNYPCAELSGATGQLSCGSLTKILHSVDKKAEPHRTDCRIHHTQDFVPRRVTSEILMCSTSGEGAGSCCAHNCKGSRSCEGNPRYANSMNVVGPGRGIRKDDRALGFGPVVRLNMMW